MVDMKIMKRDSREVQFTSEKITTAVMKVLTAVPRERGEMDETIAVNITHKVVEKIREKSDCESITVEAIQDIVEAALMESGYTDEAKAYILYRQKRTNIREARSEIMDAVADIIKETTRDNANVGNSPSGKVLQIAELVSKNYYLKRVIPPEQAKAHLDGDIYIQDLSWYGKTLTCLQIPLGKLLENGFSNGHGHIRQPKSIRSAAALAAIILQANQNEQHGGQSYAKFDYDMAPYVEAEKARQEIEFMQNLNAVGLGLACISDGAINDVVEHRTNEETFQAMEALIYNLNSLHSRAGAQVPFSSINLGTDTSWAGRMIIECFLHAYEKGLGMGEPPIFPNVIFKLKKGVNFNPGDPNYDLFQKALEIASKRLFPTFLFLDSSFNSVYDVEIACMGCRTRVVGNINGEELVDGRGNLSFTSINLPRIAIRAESNINIFMELLDETMEKAIQVLLTRYDIQKNLLVRDFPFLMGQGLYMDSEGLDPHDRIEPAIKHGTLSVGFIGLAETLVSLVGTHHGESESSQTLGLAIVNHMRKICDEASQKYGLNFSLLATPAEQLSGKFVKMDMDKFGIIPGVTDKPWYTNSFHVPVEYKISGLSKIAIEGPYHKYCNAGHITYVELESAPHNNIQGLEALIRAMADADVGYGAVNFPVDVCKNCGASGLLDESVCPKCGNENISRVRRITGYLSTLDRFNDYKKAEESSREKHVSTGSYASNAEEDFQ